MFFLYLWVLPKILLKWKSLQLFFCSGLFWLFWVFCGPMCILGFFFFSIFVNNGMGILIVIALNMWIVFWYIDHFHDVGNTNPLIWNVFLYSSVTLSSELLSFHWICLWLPWVGIFLYLTYWLQLVDSVFYNSAEFVVTRRFLAG